MGDLGTDALSGAGMGTMFGPGLGTGIGAGLGLIKYFAFDKPANDRKRALAAATQRYSPWTGLSADAPEQVNPMSSAMSGAGMGAAMGQNIAAQQQNNQLQQSQIALNKALATRSMQAPGAQSGVTGYSSSGAVNPWSQQYYLLDPNQLAAMGR